MASKNGIVTAKGAIYKVPYATQADKATNADNADNATSATRATYASTSTGKGTVEERLTNLENNAPATDGSIAAVNTRIDNIENGTTVVAEAANAERINDVTINEGSEGLNVTDSEGVNTVISLKKLYTNAVNEMTGLAYYDTVELLNNTPTVIYTGTEQLGYQGQHKTFEVHTSEGGIYRFNTLLRTKSESDLDVIFKQKYLLDYKIDYISDSTNSHYGIFGWRELIFSVIPTESWYELKAEYRCEGDIDEPLNVQIIAVYEILG